MIVTAQIHNVMSSGFAPLAERPAENLDFGLREQIQIDLDVVGNFIRPGPQENFTIVFGSFISGMGNLNIHEAQLKRIGICILGAMATS